MEGGEVDSGQRLTREPVLLAGARARLEGRHCAFELIDRFLVGSLDAGERGADVAQVAGP